MISCTRCNQPIESDQINQPGFQTCSSCDASIQVHVFPAVFRERAVGTAGETLLIDSESSCFYHTNKKAVLPCDACGRFLCSLCILDLDGKNICPSCLETGQQKNTIQTLQMHRTVYDRMALFISLLMLIPLFWIFTIITAPINIFMVFRYWNAPGSIIPTTKIRFIAAFILSSLQIAGWVYVIVLL